MQNRGKTLLYIEEKPKLVENLCRVTKLFLVVNVLLFPIV